MRRLCGIFPYIYTPTPIELKRLSFKGLIYDQPPEESKRNRDYLHKLVSMFRQGDNSPVSAVTYFFADTGESGEEFKKGLREIFEDIIVFQYFVLRTHWVLSLELASSYIFELTRWQEWLSGKTLNWVWINNMVSEINLEHIFVPNGDEIRTENLDLGQTEPSLIALENYFSGRTRIQGMSPVEEERVIRALSWYVQSFTTYTPNCRESNLASLGTAFEVLFNIMGFERKVEALRVAITTLLGDDEAQSLRKWVTEFYEERSKAVHLGWTPITSYIIPRQVRESDIVEDYYLVSGHRIFDTCLDILLENRSVIDQSFRQKLF